MFGLILAEPRKKQKSYTFRLTLLQPMRRLYVQL